MLDRVAFLLIKSLGSFAKVTVSSGDRFRGIMVAASSEGEIGCALALAEKIATAPGDEQENEVKMFDKLVFQSKDIVDIEIESPDLSLDSTTNETASTSSGSKFKTDTAISGQEGAIRERKLQRWEDSGDANAALTLEESTDTGRSWDQFAENERKFGVQSTYDEHYYTTAINRDAPDFDERERRAARLASEIENSSYGGNVHVAEERGIAVDDSGMDEEDKYSGVQRQPNKAAPSVTLPPRGPNKYTPPAFRAPTNQPNNKGIPYDPAILTSQVAGQKKAISSNAADSKPSQIHTPVSHNFGTSTPISALFNASSTSSPAPAPAPAPSTGEPGASSPVKESVPEAEPKKASTPSGAPLPPSIALPASRQGKLVVDKEKAAANSKNVNNVTKDVAGNFAQFVTTEQQKFEQKKRNLQLKEKSDSIEELKKFSQDFKIKTPVPADLFPLLGKRNNKAATAKSTSGSSTKSTTPQTSATTPASSTPTSTAADKKEKPLSEAIVEAQSSKKTPTVPSPLPANKTLEPSVSKSPTKPAAPVPAQSSPAKSTTVPASPAPKLNLNFKAPEFRPNPNAHAFTPSFSSSPSHSNAITFSNHSSPFIPHSSPVGGHNAMRGGHGQHSRTHTPHQRNANLFFGSKSPNAKPFNGKCNLFARLVEEHDKDESKPKGSPVIIERSFLTNPTWPVANNEEHSYTELVPSADIVSGRASNIPGMANSGMIPVNGMIPMAGMGGMSGSSFGYGRSPVVAGSQLPPNMGGPGMMPMMQDPRAMMGPSPMHSQGGFVYPQYQVVNGPQYGNGPGPLPGPPFFGRPPFPLAAGMMGQPNFINFQPQEFPQHHSGGFHNSHHQSPRVSHASPVPHMNQYGRQYNNHNNHTGNHHNGHSNNHGNQGYYSPQQQNQYLRSPGPQHTNHHSNGGGNNRHRNNPNSNNGANTPVGNSNTPEN